MMIAFVVVGISTIAVGLLYRRQSTKSVTRILDNPVTNPGIQRFFLASASSRRVVGTALIAVGAFILVPAAVGALGWVISVLMGSP